MSDVIDANKEEILKFIEEKLRVQIISAKPDDVIMIEAEYGLLSPDDHIKLNKFFFRCGFEKAAVVEVCPGKGNLKYSVIRSET